MDGQGMLTGDPAELTKVLRLIQAADSVELKLTIQDEDQRSAADALGMDILDADIRQVLFFDTPDLKLNAAGVIARARRIRDGDDTVVKIRPVVPSELPEDVRNSPFLKVEVDAMPGGYVCSASLKGELSIGAVKEALAEGRPLRKLFSKEQRDFFDRYAPKGVTFDDLTILGPINTMRLKFTHPDFQSRITAELWLYPDGSRILELSSKCMPQEAFQFAVEIRAFLEDQGISVSGEQQTKTSKALKYFSTNLAKAGAGTGRSPAAKAAAGSDGADEDAEGTNGPKAKKDGKGPKAEKDGKSAKAKSGK
jgi:hypothetical protein